MTGADATEACPYNCGLSETVCLEKGSPILVARQYASWEPVYQCRTHLVGMEWVQGHGWVTHEKAREIRDC